MTYRIFWSGVNSANIFNRIYKKGERGNAQANEEKM